MNTRVKKLILNILSSLIVLMIIIFAFFSLINITFKLTHLKTHVKGFSMQPTLNANVENSQTLGDTIFISKFNQIERNDIVVAKVPWWSDYIIKRLVGVPGDTIEIQEDELYYNLLVNDELLYIKPKSDNAYNNSSSGPNQYYEQYQKFISNSIFGKDFSANIIEKENGHKAIKLNEDEYFLLGDNWGQTTDCMFNGPVRKNQIIGSVSLVVPYGESKVGVASSFIFNNLFK